MEVTLGFIVTTWKAEKKTEDIKKNTLRGWNVDGTDSESYPVPGSDINSAEL